MALPPAPPLPPGRVVNLPGRGEVFARDSGGTPAAPAVLLLHAKALEWRDAAHERMAWHLPSALELELRLGTGTDIIERVLRQATARFVKHLFVSVVVD